MINTEITVNKPLISWPLRILFLLVLIQLTSVASMVINDPIELDAVIKSKISTLIGIENLGDLHSVKTTNIGPITFYKLIFFQQPEYQISANAIQVLGFAPKITCASASNTQNCQ